MTLPSNSAAALCGAVLLLRLAAADPVVGVAGGYSHSLFLKESGRLYGSGNDMYGQLGDGSSRKHVMPVHVTDGLQAVVAGYYHTLMLTKDGRAMSTGDNSDGQLGIGSSSDASRPLEVMKHVRAVAAGGSHSLFLSTDGKAMSAGFNEFGQLGDGTTHDRDRPINLNGLDGAHVQGLAAGTLHSLFLTKSGEVFAAGNNENGQLGSGDSSKTNPLPVRVLLDGEVERVAAGAYHSLFLMKDGTVYASGRNKAGQLGDGSQNDRHRPVKVKGVKGVVDMAGGFHHSLFVCSSGGSRGAWSVGANGRGQLGDGKKTDRARVHKVPGSGSVERVAAGALHSLFLMKDGTVSSAGSDFWGQLAAASGSDSSTLVNALVPWRHDSAGEDLGARFEVLGALPISARRGLAAGAAVACVCTVALLLMAGAAAFRRGSASDPRVRPLAEDAQADSAALVAPS